MYLCIVLTVASPLTWTGNYFWFINCTQFFITCLSSRVSDPCNRLKFNFLSNVSFKATEESVLMQLLFPNSRNALQSVHILNSWLTFGIEVQFPDCHKKKRFQLSEERYNWTCYSTWFCFGQKHSKLLPNALHRSLLAAYAWSISLYAYWCASLKFMIYA